MRVILADDQVSLRSALRLLLEHEANAHRARAKEGRDDGI
jgi:hypothetical protein